MDLDAMANVLLTFRNHAAFSCAEVPLLQTLQ
jgi:hypothetical protein